MKIKNKIRDKLRHWLFSEELSKFESAEQNYKDAEDLYNRAKGYLNAAKDEYGWSFKLVDDCHQLMNSMMDVGTDIGFNSDDHSWAVVCIKGHPEYVKFIPLEDIYYHQKLYKRMMKVLSIFMMQIILCRKNITVI